MISKKQIITIASLCIASFALGYWCEGQRGSAEMWVNHVLFIIFIPFCFLGIMRILATPINITRYTIINRIAPHAIALIFSGIFLGLCLYLLDERTFHRDPQRAFLATMFYAPFCYALIQIVRAIIFLSNKLWSWAKN